MNNNKINIVNSTEGKTLVATVNFAQLPSDRAVTWKQQIIEKDEVAKNPQRLLFTLEDKGTLLKTSTDLMMTYTFKKEEVGKYIKFYAYIEKFETIQQSTIFYVEDKCNTDVRIRGVRLVDPSAKEISVGGQIKLKVNKYSVADNKVSSKVKDCIKWMIKVGDNKNERLIIDGLVVTGDEIEIDMQENWIGNKILFMPYLNIHTPKVSCQTQVASKNIIECYWTNEKKEKIEALSGDISKAFFYIKMIGYECGETISIRISDENGDDILPGQKEVIVEGPVDAQGEVWVEAYNYVKE